MTERMLPENVQRAILDSLARGNSVEVKQNKEGIVVYEVQKKIKCKPVLQTGNA